jgi:hypothetical protein
VGAEEEVTGPIGKGVSGPPGTRPRTLIKIGLVLVLLGLLALWWAVGLASGSAGLVLRRER